MGLLLSILVACIGVAELIAFYAHVRRSLVRPNTGGGDLETIVLNYKSQLTSKYRRILSTIYEEDRVETNYSLAPSPGIIFNRNPTNDAKNLIPPTQSLDGKYPKATTTDGTLDIRKQASTSRTNPENVVAFGTDVPKNKPNDRSQIQKVKEVPNSPPHSIPFEEIDVINQNLYDSLSMGPLPGIDYESGHKTEAVSILCLKSEKSGLPVDDLIQKRRSPSPFTNSKALTPSDNFLSEKEEIQNDLPLNSELGQSTAVIADNSSAGIEFWPKLSKLQSPTSLQYADESDSTLTLHESSSDDVPSTEFSSNSIRIECGGRERSRSKSRSRSPLLLQRHQIEKTEAPQELLVLPIPPILQYDTLNLSTEINLLNVNVESDFDDNFTPALRRRRRRSKSFSSESDVILIGNALRKVVSATQLVPRDYWRRSPSPFQRFAIETNLSDVDVSEDAIKQFQLVNVPFDDGFKNSLDGVNEEKKREFRKKRHAQSKSRKQQTGEIEESPFFTKYPQELAVSNEELEVIATQNKSRSPLVLSGELLEEETPVQGSNKWEEVKSEPSTSNTSTQDKKPEPFWVNGTYSEASLK